MDSKIKEKYIAKIVMTHNGNYKIRKYYDWKTLPKLKRNVSASTHSTCTRKRAFKETKIITERSLRRTRTRIYSLIENNINDMHSFITLTFKDEIDDYTFAHRHLQNYIRKINYHLNKENKEFKYICVPEIQERRAETCGKNVIHFHLLTNLTVGSFFIPEQEIIKIRDYTNNKWHSLQYYNLKFWNHGYSYAKALSQDSNIAGLSYYLAKYLSKANNASFFNRRKLLHSNNLKESIEDYITEEKELFQIMKDYEPYLVRTYSHKCEKDYMTPFTDYEYYFGSDASKVLGAERYTGK